MRPARSDRHFALTGLCAVLSLAAVQTSCGSSANDSVAAPGVSLEISGGGSVTSEPTGISCGAQCSASYEPGTIVTLTQTAPQGGDFLGWGGACIGAGQKCIVRVQGTVRVAARFATLDAQCKDGRLDGNETDLDCGGSCAPCTSGLSCSENGDCQSGSCTSARCTTPPAFDGILPALGGTQGGTQVVLSGEGFVPGNGLAAYFGALPALATEYLSPTHILVRTPPSVGIGAVDVALQLPGRPLLALPKSFRYFYGSVAFETANLVPTGSYPEQAAAGDLNGDGKMDVVVTNGASANVSVHLGNGDFTFQPQSNYAMGTNPTRVVLADLNGDNKLDIVTTVFTDGTVVVRLGNGDGTFGAATNYTSPDAQGLAVVDVNKDKKLDIVSTNRTAGAVSVMLGNGDGTFAARTSTAATAMPVEVAAADLDGDGDVDLVTNSLSDMQWGVLLGNGDGTFQSPVLYNVATPQLGGLSLADFNNDGVPDVAIAVHDSKTVDIFQGKGDGSFVSLGSYPAGTDVLDVQARDLDLDGNMDLLISNAGDDNVSLLRGQGNGSFRAAGTFSAASRPYRATLSDLDGDGRADLIVVQDEVSGGMRILRNLSQ